jgi:hypothetical protein
VQQPHVHSAQVQLPVSQQPQHAQAGHDASAAGVAGAAIGNRAVTAQSNNVVMEALLRNGIE